jgi:hypothetical protein
LNHIRESGGIPYMSTRPKPSRRLSSRSCRLPPRYRLRAGLDPRNQARRILARRDSAGVCD